MSVEYGEIDASNGVEIDAANEVNPACTNVASDVYLALWWRRATSAEICFEEFGCLAETWLKIREMEDIREKYITSMAMPEGLAMSEPEKDEDPDLDYKKLYMDLVDSLLQEDVHPAPAPEEVQIDQHTFVSKTDAEAEIEAKWFNPEKKQKSAAKSAAGKASFARRKQAALEAVKSARASGCTLQGIADQSSLSLPKVLDLINGEPCPVTDWTKLEKGLKKLGHPPRVITKEEEHEQEG